MTPLEATRVPLRPPAGRSALTDDAGTEDASPASPATTAFDAWHLEQLQKELTVKHLESARSPHPETAPIRMALPPDRRALVIRLAPPAPPCFHDRLAWLEYLVEAQASMKGSDRGPLDMRSGSPQFNHELDYCADCSARHAMAMQKERRCDPDHLRELAVDQATAVTGG